MTLHVTNGDSAAGTLRAFLTDPVLVTCDVLHDGPAPAVDDDSWYNLRARFLSDGFHGGYEPTRDSLALVDRTITGGAYDDVVLWFEHDLFDQLLLIRTLDLIARRGRPGRVALICIGEFPGIERFVGLGQLNAPQLESLYPQRVAVSPEQFAEAARAWQAFRSSDPRTLASLGQGASALRFLPAAIHRLLEEYPSTSNGLSRTADAALRILDSGPREAFVLFQLTQADEPRPFLGDTGFFDILRKLASGRVPLVTPTASAEARDLPRHVVALTPAGRDVLDGRADAVALNGIDEWRGGVHLTGGDRSPWRWDRNRETLVS